MANGSQFYLHVPSAPSFALMVIGARSTFCVPVPFDLNLKSDHESLSRRVLINNHKYSVHLPIKLS